MKYAGMAVWAIAGTLLAAAQAAAWSEVQQGEGQVVVTVLPRQPGALPSSVANQDFAVTVNGRNARVTAWTPYRDPADKMELVLLIDGSARMSLGREMGDMERFVDSLPPNIKAGIAYMENGEAVFAGPLSADHAQVLRNLHLPGGTPGSDGSPYFCLSDLAKRWPSQDAGARREVVMITDGVDRYAERYDPNDPYMLAAIEDATRARLVVYSIYWTNQGFEDGTSYENIAGQNLLLELTSATGGKSFWQGMGNPVSFTRYFDELIRRFQNQYELGVSAPLGSKPQVETLKLKLSAPGTEVDVPGQVYMTPGVAKP
jgi:hypothetical protein